MVVLLHQILLTKMFKSEVLGYFDLIQSLFPNCTANTINLIIIFQRLKKKVSMPEYLDSNNGRDPRPQCFQYKSLPFLNVGCNWSW